MAVCVLCLVLEGGIAITIGYGFVVLGRDNVSSMDLPG